MFVCRVPGNRIGSALVGAALIASLLAGATAAIAQTIEDDPVQEVVVELSSRDVSVDPDGSFEFDVTTGITAAAEYLEVRLQVNNPGGSLMYQKTEIRHDVEPGALTLTFARELDDLALTEGRYPVDVRVLVTDAEPTEVSGRMLVIEPSRDPLSVALLARFDCTPARDPEGRFVEDPSADDPTMAAASGLAEAARPTGPVSLALPPVMLDDWSSGSQGYATVGPEGVRQVPAEADVPMALASALDKIGSSAQVDSIELLSVPFAEPDLAGLEAMVATEDLTEHISTGAQVYSTLGLEPVPGIAIAGDAWTEATLPLLTDSAMDFAVVRADQLASEEETPVTGAFRSSEAGLTLLALDDLMSAALESADPVTAVVDRAFEIAISDDGSDVVIAQSMFGPGRGGDHETFIAVAQVLESLPWVDLVTCSDAASMPSGDVQVAANASQGAPAPMGYWSEVLEAHRLSEALTSAAGHEDEDAADARRALLIAESRCWAGPDQGWGLADRGRAFAASAVRRAQEILAAVVISAGDVTLSGTRGLVPISILNPSEKTLQVTVVVDSDTAVVGPPSIIDVELLHAENYLTLPVDLAGALRDDLSIEVRAGGTVITETQVTVSASYLERLVVVATIVLVLAGLLFYIRRRVMD